MEKFFNRAVKKHAILVTGYLYSYKTNQHKNYEKFIISSKFNNRTYVNIRDKMNNGDHRYRYYILQYRFIKFPSKNILEFILFICLYID